MRFKPRADGGMRVDVTFNEMAYLWRACEAATKYCQQMADKQADIEDKRLILTDAKGDAKPSDEAVAWNTDCVVYRTLAGEFKGFVAKHQKKVEQQRRARRAGAN